jgi:hypothetical protein
MIMAKKSASFLKRISLKRIAFRLFLLLYFVSLVSVIAFHIHYANKVLPNIYLNGENVGGKNIEELEAIVERQTSAPVNVSIVVKDYSRQISQADIDFVYLKKATIKKVFSVGRSSNFFDSLKSKILSFVDVQNIDYEYSYDEDYNVDPH